MKTESIQSVAGAAIVLLAVHLATVGLRAQQAASQSTDEPWTPTIPKTWDDDVMKNLELPLADSRYSAVHMTSDFYYQIPIRKIYKTYPVYHPDKEPAGYLEGLKRREPEIVFNADQLKTKEDWVRAGELIFNDPIIDAIGMASKNYAASLYVRDRRWHQAVKAPITADGVLPFYRYIIRQKGEVRLGVLSCASCHTRVLSDGSVIIGGQGNFPMDRAMAYDYRNGGADLSAMRSLERMLFSADWLDKPDAADISREEIIGRHEAIPGGVVARHRSDPSFPVVVPDLFDLEQRAYLDRTGLQRHRDIADLMRYAALNQQGDDMSRFGDFTPFTAFTGGRIPPPSALKRYSDEQLYAVALYVYSLKAPKNPNKLDDLARRGKEVFLANDCQHCHTPTHYTNNKLTPADNFDIPASHFNHYAIEDESLGTDPNLTMKTRRGTGYYKVPSLRHIWARGPLGHDGSCASLEDWFDPRRLDDDYAPTGFVGYRVTKRAVLGHEYGLDLSTEERKALIAFLKTL